MKTLIELPNELYKPFKEDIEKQVNENLNKCLSSIITEIDKEKGIFKITPSFKENKLLVNIMPQGFSDELTIKIKKLLPKL